MKKRTLFIKLAAIPLISTMIFFLLSIINVSLYFNYDRYITPWEFFYSYSYVTAAPIGVWVTALLILIGLFTSFVFFIKNIIKLFMYAGFPSIKDAKHYYKELKKIKRASLKQLEKKRLEKSHQEYQLKMAKLEEEKKKFL